MNISLSKSRTDKQQYWCWLLQVSLVLFLISPLNDNIVVRAAMVLKFEKNESVNKEKTKNSFKLSNLIIKSFVYISDPFFHVHTKTFALKSMDFWCTHEKRSKLQLNLKKTNCGTETNKTLFKIKTWVIVISQTKWIIYSVPKFWFSLLLGLVWQCFHKASKM